MCSIISVDGSIGCAGRRLLAPAFVRETVARRRAPTLKLAITSVGKENIIHHDRKLFTVRKALTMFYINERNVAENSTTVFEKALRSDRLIKILYHTNIGRVFQSTIITHPFSRIITVVCRNSTLTRFIDTLSFYDLLTLLLYFVNLLDFLLVFFFLHSFRQIIIK